MAARSESQRTSVVGRGMTRPIVAYLAIVIVDVWVGYAVADARQGGDVVRAALVAFAELLGSGVVTLTLVFLLLFPAMVLTVELVDRFEAPSRLTRSIAGAASWAAWCLVVAITLAVASGVVVVPEMLAGLLVAVAASGAAFSLLAFDESIRHPGHAWTLLALVVAAFVVIGSIWMSGRWGGPV
jgi:hypothetical protein